MSSKCVLQRSKQGKRPSDRGSRFNSHLRTNTLLHSYEKVFRCEICGELYRLKAKLMKHLLSHEVLEKARLRNSRKLLVFEKCIKSQDRMVVVHSGGGGGTLACEVCGKLYRHERRLRRHMLVNHAHGTSLRRHDFSKLSALDSSPESHVSPCSEDVGWNGGAKTHGAIPCSEDVSWNGAAVTDATASTGEKSLDCQVCGKSYKYEKRLREHLLMHISDRSFKCESSGRRSLPEPSTKSQNQLVNQGDAFRNPSPTSSEPHTASGTRNGELPAEADKKRLIERDEENKESDDTESKTFRGLCQQGESSPKTSDKPLLQEACNDSTVNEDDSFDGRTSTHSRQDGSSSEASDAMSSRENKRWSDSFTKTNDILRFGEEPMNCAVCGKSYKYRKRLVKHLIMHDMNRKPKSKTLHGKRQDGSFSNHTLTTSTHEGYSETSHAASENHALRQDGSSDDSTATSATQESSRELINQLSSREDGWKSRAIPNAHPGTSEATMDCQICGKAYKYKESLRQHLLKHRRNRRPQSGRVCRPETRDKEVVLVDGRQDDSSNSHTSTSPSGVVVIQKGSCNNHHVGSQENRLNTQVLVNGKPRPGEETVYCEICGKTFKHWKTLMRHVIKHNRGQRLKRESLGEDGRLKRKSLDKPSTQETSGTSNGMISAQDSISGSAIKPDILTNTGEKPLQCGICGKSYLYQKSLRKHLLLHGSRANIKSRDIFKLSSPDSSVTETGTMANATEAKLMCKICGKFYKNKATLNRHTLLHMVGRDFQSEKKDLRCKVFRQRSQLLTHSLLTHGGEKKDFECNDCGKRFEEMLQLRRHILEHTGEHSFTCGVCGHLYVQTCHLDSHVLNKCA